MIDNISMAYRNKHLPLDVQVEINQNNRYTIIMLLHMYHVLPHMYHMLQQNFQEYKICKTEHLNASDSTVQFLNKLNKI